MVDPAALFDIQVKRIHEYKRQHLNALHIITLYQRLRRNPQQDIAPRCFVFGGKAAPGYHMAKLIIRLITGVAEVVNQDAAVAGRLKVVFFPDFNVKNAHAIYPAADLSEQISTAGKEASGTGNMKFMLNGALTIGTLDGANVEIREEVGDDNFFLFGLTAEEVDRVKRDGYRPAECVERNDELREALELVASGHFARGDREVFRPLVENLLHSDPFLVLADYADYLRMPGARGRRVERPEALDAHVDPQHRPRRQVLVGPLDPRVLRQDLEDSAVRIFATSMSASTARSWSGFGVSSASCYVSGARLMIRSRQMFALPSAWPASGGCRSACVRTRNPEAMEPLGSRIPVLRIQQKPRAGKDHSFLGGNVVSVGQGQRRRRFHRGAQDVGIADDLVQARCEFFTGYRQDAMLLKQPVDRQLHLRIWRHQDREGGILARMVKTVSKLPEVGAISSIRS